MRFLDRLFADDYDGPTGGGWTPCPVCGHMNEAGEPCRYRAAHTDIRKKREYHRQRITSDWSRWQQDQRAKYGDDYTEPRLDEGS